MKDAIIRKLKQLSERLKLKQYLIIYLPLLLVLVVLATVLLISPRLDKGDGWIGIRAQRNSMTGTLMVVEIMPNSPAYDVGIVNGDAILSYRGIAVADLFTLKQLIQDSYINEVVRIVIERNGSRLVADTRIAQKPDSVLGLSPRVIVQGARAPHPDRGACVNCHTILPRVR